MNTHKYMALGNVTEGITYRLPRQGESCWLAKKESGPGHFFVIDCEERVLLITQGMYYTPLQLYYTDWRGKMLGFIDLSNKVYLVIYSNPWKPTRLE